jgi:hypothetical protein
MHGDTVIEGQIRGFCSGDAVMRRGHDFRRIITIPVNFHNAMLPSLWQQEYLM